jgi:hypothetical protein
MPPWLQLAAALIGAVTTAILTFTSLISVPLDARLFVVGAAIVVLLFAVVSSIRRRTSWPQRRRRVVAAVAATLMAGLLVEALRFTVGYHSIVIRRNDTGKDGAVTIAPSRTPAEVTLLISLDPGRIEKARPGFTGEAIGAFGIVKDTASAKTYELHQFVYPQAFEITYSVSPSADRLTVIPRVAPATIEIVEPVRRRHLLTWFFVIGGVVWLAGLWSSLRRF